MTDDKMTAEEHRLAGQALNGIAAADSAAEEACAATARALSACSHINETARKLGGPDLIKHTNDMVSYAEAAAEHAAKLHTASRRLFESIISTAVEQMGEPRRPEQE